MKKIGDINAQRSDVKPLREETWSDEKNLPENITEEIFIKHIKGPLFFGSTTEFQQLASQIPDTASTVVIRMGRMQYMDQSGLYAMEDVLQDLKRKNVMVLLVGILDQPKYMMERIDIIPGLIPQEHIFESFKSCMNWVGQNSKNSNP
jgi:SulP family sulfate permease